MVCSTLPYVPASGDAVGSYGGTWPWTASEHKGQVTELLTLRLPGPETSCEARLMSWERQLADYEAQHRRTLDNDMRRAIIMAQAPEALTQHMAVYEQSLPTYQSVRQPVMNCLASRQVRIVATGGGKRSTQCRRRAWIRRAQVERRSLWQRAPLNCHIRETIPSSGTKWFNQGPGNFDDTGSWPRQSPEEACEILTVFPP